MMALLMTVRINIANYRYMELFYYIAIQSECDSHPSSQFTTYLCGWFVCVYVCVHARMSQGKVVCQNYKLYICVCYLDNWYMCGFHSYPLIYVLY